MRDVPVGTQFQASRDPKTFKERVRNMFDTFVDKYPWAAFMLVWLLWVGGTLWEYRIHRSKQVTAGWMLLLFGVLGFAASQAGSLGVWRWVLAALVILVGWAVIRYILKKQPRTDGRS